MLESGRHATVCDLAKAEVINESYLGRVLRLTLLSPSIIEATAGKDQSHSALDAVSGLFRGAQVPRKPANSAAQRPVIVGIGGIVGIADEVGHRCVAQHSPAIGQRRATEAQHLSVRKVDIDRSGIP
jgi:hypothetical protein